MCPTLTGRDRKRGVLKSSAGREVQIVHIGEVQLSAVELS